MTGLLGYCLRFDGEDGGSSTYATISLSLRDGGMEKTMGTCADQPDGGSGRSSRAARCSTSTRGTGACRASRCRASRSGRAFARAPRSPGYRRSHSSPGRRASPANRHFISLPTSWKPTGKPRRGPGPGRSGHDRAGSGLRQRGGRRPPAASGNSCRGGEGSSRSAGACCPASRFGTMMA